jgi:hypothetical protein
MVERSRSGEKSVPEVRAVRGRGTRSANGRPWTTDAASVRERDGRTEVDVEWSADRGFGLRRPPQWLVTERYRADALGAQGEAVAERDASLSVGR